MSPEQVLSSSSETSSLIGQEPETPFVLDGIARTGAAMVTSPARAFGPAFEVHTPFLSEYGLDGMNAAGRPRAEFFAALMAELRDSEFEEAVADLVHEASAMVQEQFAYEGGDTDPRRLYEDGRGNGYLDGGWCPEFGARGALGLCPGSPSVRKHSSEGTGYPRNVDCGGQSESCRCRPSRQ